MVKKRRAEAPAAEATHGGAGYYTFTQRLAMAIAWLLYKFEVEETKGEALERVWNFLKLGDIPRNAESWMEPWYDRLVATGSVHDAPHPGHPLLSDALAREAADIIRAGHTIVVSKRGQPDDVKHYWFRSWGEALRRSPRLQQILASSGVTADTLFARIHKVAPDLKKSRVHMKLALDATRIASRVKCAKWFNSQLAQDPKFLDQCVWIDQVKIWLFGGKAMDVSVWHPAHAADFDACIPCCGAVDAKPMHICIYVAVNALGGLVFWQYVTGCSKGWLRKAWPDLPYADERLDPDWKVSGVLHNICRV